jgi:hypothetical protein
MEWSSPSAFGDLVDPRLTQPRGGHDVAGVSAGLERLADAVLELDVSPSTRTVTDAGLTDALLGTVGTPEGMYGRREMTAYLRWPTPCILCALLLRLIAAVEHQPRSSTDIVANTR